jgi:hypothetical protein
MLGNKNFYKENAKTNNFSLRKTSFLFNFSKISCNKHKGISLKLRATYALKCTEKTYEKRLLPSY